MPTNRTRTPARRRGPEPELDEALVAFLRGDAGYFVEKLALKPWDDGVLVDFDKHLPVTEGSRRACALRRRLVARLEELGGFSVGDLESDDAQTSIRTWDRLEVLYRTLGLDPDQYLREEDGTDA